MQARAAASLARLSLLPRLTRSFLPPAHHGLLLAVRLQLRQGAGARLGSSASSKGSGAAESAAGKDGGGSSSSSGEAGADGGGAAGGDGLEEPLVARVSRFIWGSIKVTLGAAVMGALLYSGYSIVMVLLPVGTSSNRIMLKASSILEGDPEVTAYYGQIKTYGVDLGGRNEGRRMFVPEHKYTDDLNGMPYHRIKFSLEGERNKKATVWAEVASSTGEFRYLIVTGRGDSKVISIVDRRPAVLSLVERQARVSTLLQDAGWVFLCDNEVDARMQGKELGDYWLKCKSSQDGERLRGVGALGGSCGWVTPGGEAVAGGRGIKDLAQLESMVLPLARGDKPGWFSGITSFFSGSGGGGGGGGGKPALG